MKSTTINTHADLIADFENGKADGLAIFRRQDFVGKKAELADRKTRLESLAEQVAAARRQEFEAQRIKLDAEREVALAASIRAQQPLASLREAADRALAEYRAGLSKYEDANALVPSLETQIERVRSLEVQASESAPEIDWLDVHIEDLAKQALASQDRDGRYRVHVGAVTITTNNSPPAEALEQLHKTNPDKRGVILKALRG